MTASVSTTCACPTADGIDVGLEAKISFTTGFTGQ